VSSQEGQFDKLLEFLRQNRGFDFSGYKRPSLMRRVERRTQVLGIAGFEEYTDYLEVHPEEFALLFNTILINVTSFFRDEAAWEFVAREVIPAIAGKAPEAAIRVWSAGCASGEEAYTMAILLAEALGSAAFVDRVKIYATDVDEEALNQARQGSYSPKQAEAVPEALREKYFVHSNGRLVFRPELRRAMIFGRHDLVQDAPISRLDLLVCRNTLMYFNAETQRRVLEKFDFALNGEGTGKGYLFLGRAEMLLIHSQLFAPVELKYRVFQKLLRPGARAAAASEMQDSNGGGMVQRQRLHDMANEESPMARIVVDADGTLSFANQRARSLFSIARTDVGRPLKDLEIAYRPLELRSLIEQAYAERRTLVQAGVERRFAAGEPQFLEVMIAPFFDQAQQPLGVGVTFIDITRVHALHEEVRAAREEIQTAHEELQSSNEELETTNEELQSTNEELETMNEELQSTNEELQALNEELRQRTDELHHSNAFLESVLASLHSAAIVVDRNLDVLMWNHRAEDLWGLRADEVKNTSLLNLDIGLPVAELRGMIRPCLAGESEGNEVILDAVNRRGKKIRCRVSCAPLLAAGKRQGAILVMDESTAG
jgi:two-component system, chemotaxis family, CheB/CheR fusion protein